MQLNVSDCFGHQLNWLVALADGCDEGWLIRQLGNPNPDTRAIADCVADWGDAGPIIERENLTLRKCWGGGKPVTGAAAWRCDLDFKDGAATHQFCAGSLALQGGEVERRACRLGRRANPL